jgi:TPP-dependent pyruvate/acetoin dehydrogenase alpha subunit
VRVVLTAVQEAVSRARRGEGPTLIEAQTYRFDEHQVGLLVEKNPYRSAEEVELHRRQRDPITLYRQALHEEGVPESELLSIEREVDAAVAEAIRFAEDSPLPDPAALYDHLYSTPLQ